MLRNAIAMFTLVAFVAWLPGCKSVASVPMPGAVKPTEDPTEIAGFTTRDGRLHELNGWAVVEGEQFIVWTNASSDEPASARSGQVYKGPVADVQSVEVRYTNGWATFGIVMGVVILTLGIILAIAILSKTSCPFIYSWDGKQYVFDGEPYGGAVAQSLARTDYSELKHLAADDGQYRLLLTNEVDETQHTDSLALLAVDHRPSDSVILGADGKVHAFSSIEHLMTAHDERGSDLMPFLAEVDRLSWLSNLDDATQELPVADTRNHIELTFQRPKTDEPVFLLTNVATAPWGSLQIRTLLGMRGTGVQDFYRSLDSSPKALQRLLAWNEQEELYHLKVWLLVNGRWEKRAVITAGGPFISENRAVPLDLSGVEGGTVRIRLDPPIGFWRFNAFKLAWGEGPSQVQTLKARSARDENGRDVVAELEKDDGRTLDQADAPNVTRIEFDAPPLPPGLVRTVFAKTRGWYEVHLHDLGPPDVAALKRLESEAGYAVQRALADYVTFQRTHVLPGIPASAQARGQPSVPH
jgi:hypothetical protein